MSLEMVSLRRFPKIQSHGSASFHFDLPGWINREQQAVIEYLHEEINVLRELFGSKKLRFSDDQRRRLARKAKQVKFGRLKEFCNVATPQTLLAWFRRLEAAKYPIT